MASDTTSSEVTTIRTLLTTVSAVELLHPRLRSITFRGGDLHTFAPLGPDTFLYVLLPPPGRSALTIDQSFTWGQWKHMPPAEQPVGAYYTLRYWRPETAELEMWFVLHEPAGPACTWAATATAGDPVALWGPREAYAPPPGTNDFVLIADETGLPAVAAIIDSLGAETRVRVVAEIDDPDERQPLPERDGVEIQWIHRRGRPAGRDHRPLLDAVRALDLSGDDLYVWGGGESRAMTAVRHVVREECGIAQERVSLVGYWRHEG